RDGRPQSALTAVPLSLHVAAQISIAGPTSVSAGAYTAQMSIHMSTRRAYATVILLLFSASSPPLSAQVLDVGASLDQLNRISRTLAQNHEDMMNIAKQYTGTCERWNLIFDIVQTTEAASRALHAAETILTLSEVIKSPRDRPTALQFISGELQQYVELFEN